MMQFPPYPIKGTSSAIRNYHETVRLWLVRQTSTKVQTDPPNIPILGDSWLDSDDCDSTVSGFRPTLSLSSTTTLVSTDYIVFCDTSGGAFGLVVPAATTVEGKAFVIKMTADSANAVTITTNGGDIEAGSSVTIQFLESIEVASDGMDWWIIG